MQCNQKHFVTKSSFFFVRDWSNEGYFSFTDIEVIV